MENKFFLKRAASSAPWLVPLLFLKKSQFKQRNSHVLKAMGPRVAVARSKKRRVVIFRKLIWAGRERGLWACCFCYGFTWGKKRRSRPMTKTNPTTKQGCEGKLCFLGVGGPQSCVLWKKGWPKTKPLHPLIPFFWGKRDQKERSKSQWCHLALFFLPHSFFYGLRAHTAHTIALSSPHTHTTYSFFANIQECLSCRKLVVDTRERERKKTKK